MRVARHRAGDVVADREQPRAREREDGADRPKVLGSCPLERKRGAAGDDQRRPDQEPGIERLVQHDERDRDRDQRRGADQDRRPRRPGVADGEDEEDLRAAGDENADQEERPQVGGAHVLRDERRDREHRRDDERNAGEDDRSDLRIGACPQAEADGDREQPEERSRQHAEEDCEHVLGSAGVRVAHPHGEDHLRAPGRRHGGGDRPPRRPDPARGRDRDDGLPPVRGARPRPGRGADPSSYVDHNVLQVDDQNPEDHATCGAGRALRRALLAARERDLALPPPGALRPAGWLLVGADSHSTMAGAVGMLAIGAGGQEVAVAMGGYASYPSSRRSWRVELTGRLGPWVSRRTSSSNSCAATGCAAAAARVRVPRRGRRRAQATDRGTICNMVIETGATTGVFPSDARTREWLAPRAAGTSSSSSPPTPAPPTTRRRHRPGPLEPLIALPSSPGNVVPVREVAGTPSRRSASAAP